MSTYYLRQSATIVFGPTTAGLFQEYLVLPEGCLGTPNTRLVACQAVSGPGATANYVNAPSGPTFSIDVGGGGAAGFSTDILIWNEVPGDSGLTNVLVGVNSADTGSYCAAWVGEYVEIDQSNYGYQGNTKDANGNVDYDGSTGAAGSGSTVNCTRTGGQTCNYTPELSVWFASGTGVQSVTGQTYEARGYVTDNANIWLAVQDHYFNATGLYNPAFTLGGAAPNWYWANLTMKTLAYPLGTNPLLLLGVG